MLIEEYSYPILEYHSSAATLS